MSTQLSTQDGGRDELSVSAITSQPAEPIVPHLEGDPTPFPTLTNIDSPIVHVEPISSSTPVLDEVVPVEDEPVPSPLRR